MAQLERRHFENASGLTIERRCGCDGENTPFVRGTAVVFDSLSKDLGGFVERISPAAFDDILAESRDASADPIDVVALWNHESGVVLGRTPRTLRLQKDERGVHFDLELPRSRPDILEAVERGDVNACSFGFVVGKGNDSWATDEQGRSIRTVNRIQKLIEVSLVTHPAYPATSLEVARRSLDGYLQSRRELLEHYREVAERLAKFATSRGRG